MQEQLYHRTVLLLVLACLAAAGLWPLGARGQDGYRVEIVAAAPAGIADGIAKSLAVPGARLVTGDGKTVAELWLRNQIPLKAGAGEGYSALAEGTLVGVLNFPQGGADFRGQNIPAGAYTLRYEHIPQDGNHLGASPEPDFLLLCPAAEDKNPDAAFDFDNLVELSRHATKTNHPGPLMLLPPAGGAEFPGMARNDLGYVALRLKTSAKLAGSETVRDFPVALTLVGRAE